MHPMKIIKNRSDIGAGTRGSDMGIDAIEIAAINADNDYFNRFSYVDVQTHNESIYNKVKDEFAKRIYRVRKQCERVANAVCQVLIEGQFPLVISGDHSSALGTMSGIRAFDPSMRLGVVWIDAHADLHSPYTSPSGNVHGMPLAAALSMDNKKTQLNNVEETTRKEWKKMKNLCAEGPLISPSDLIFYGVRSAEASENKLRKEYNIRNYQVSEVRYRGIEVCVKEAASQLQACGGIYLSFDVDSLDCDMVSYGTGTPVSKGFDPEEVVTIIKRIIDTKKVMCLEIAEVNPLLDFKGNKMAETVFSILDEVTSYWLND